MTFRCSAEFKAQLDDIRRAQEDLPSRTEMLHRLVENEAKRIERCAKSA